MTQVINMGVFPFLHYYVHWMRQDSCGVCCITNNFTSFQHKLKILREKIRTKRVHRQIQTHWVQDYRLSPLLVQTHTYKSVCSAWHFVHTHKLSGWQHGGCSIIASRVNNKQIRRTKNRHTNTHMDTQTETLVVLWPHWCSVYRDSWSPGITSCRASVTQYKSFIEAFFQWSLYKSETVSCVQSRSTSVIYSVSYYILYTFSSPVLILLVSKANMKI